MQGSPPPGSSEPEGTGSAPRPNASNTSGTPAGTTSTGLDPHVAGLLSYVFGWVSGLIFLIVEKEHREVRFHAAQSLALSLAAIGVWVVVFVLSFIPVLGILFWILGVIAGLGFLALWVYLLIQGYQLNHFTLPVVGDMAERWAAG